MKKKLLSILICMTIAVGMFPTMAYATVDGTEIENQQVITPEQPEATQIPTSYIVSCENHDSVQMDLIWDTFTIGKVTERDGSYVCPITIATNAYAEKYSTATNKKHTAVEENITYNMTWTGTEWKAPGMTQLPEIKVKCEKEVVPAAPEATQIPTSYIVSCENHDSVQMDLIWDTFTIGKVTDRDGSYVCPITIATNAYAEKYSTATNKKHTAVEENITYNMTWTGTEWKAPGMTQLPEIKVKCEKEVVPAAPEATQIPTSYIVSCENHDSVQMDLIWDTFTIGKVTDRDGSYVCPITIATNAYAEKYSTVTNKKHTAVEENITYNMTWTGTEWKAPGMTQLPEIKVKCEKEVVPAAPEATQIPTSYIVSCENHDSVQMDLIWDTFTIGKVTDRDGSYVCPITIATNAYAEKYSTATNKKHTAVEENITYDMTWTGTEWKAPEMTQLPEIEVKCEKEVVPAAPEATQIPTSYIVSCKNHDSVQMDLIKDTFTIGKVTERDGSYVCPITIATNAYAEKYSTATNKKHTAVEENITYDMTWTGTEWKAPEMTQLPEIEVKCEKEVVPAAPEATQIPTSYIVSCKNHDSVQMDLIKDTFTIGKVTERDGSYVCPITIATNAYAEKYSTATNKKHTAVEENITYDMTWTGTEWKAPEMTQLPEIEVKCEKEVVPAAPEATQIPTSYIVSCKNHDSVQMDLIKDTFTIGKVTERDGSYVCPITIATNAYAEKYSTATNKKHTAVEENITYDMTWTGTEWKAPEMTQLPEIEVKCEKEVVPAAPEATQIPTSYIVSCKNHDSVQMDLIKDTFTIGKVTDRDGSYVCPITIATNAYAEKYSTVTNKKHTAVEENITYDMTWTGTEWKAPEMTQLPEIEVKCEKEVVPAAPEATQIPTSYIVSCKNHDSVQMDLIKDTFTIGKVTDRDGSYVCPITIATNAYAEKYSTVTNKKHTAVEENITYNMTWTGTEWKAPEMTQLPEIEVKCEKEVVPAAPEATQIPTSYIVSCKNHDSVQMDLIWDTFTIGKVTDRDGSYVCPITIATNAYAEKYSTATNKKHTAVEKNITYNMTWTGTEWKAPEMTQLPEIKVKCKKEVVPAAPEATQIPTSYIVSCKNHDSVQMDLIKDTFTIGKVTDRDGSYVCPITIATNAYAEKYSTATNKKHTAVEENITYNMTWTGTEWKAPEMTQLPEIKVKCEKEVVPAAPKANKLPMGYMVKCTKRSFFHKVFHKARFMHQLPKTVTIGKVKKKGNNYVCKISVSTKSYAKAYSKKFGKVHAAIKRKITYQMTWNGKQWKAPTYRNLPTILLK